MVRYLGNVGPEDRALILGGAAALIHPIGFAEPFGLSVVEAMACGTPVVAYPKGSMPEIVDVGVTGFLAGGVGEAAEAVDDAPALDRRLVRRTAVARFSADRTVCAYLRVYESRRGEPAAPPTPRRQAPSAAGSPQPALAVADPST